MQIYNTLTREKEEFKSLKDNIVKIYYCGPTVYNFAHIGNLKTYTGHDVIVKAMKFLWYPVVTTMNITDIEDKIIRTAQETWEALQDFTQRYTEEFLIDIKKLWIQKADNIEPISNVIPEMVRMINTMLKRWFAYEADGSVYFEVKKFKTYWKFAHLDFDWMKNSIRIDNDEYDKESAADFVLWKWWKEEDWENFWDETFIVNWKDITIKWRPGWHIECSACAMKHFWQQIDIHMWAIDLVFPHHQNEIAQTEACTRKTFSKYWVHQGHLMVDGKKMSKSLGNFYTLRDLEEKFSNTPKDILYLAIRLNFINCKYRDSVDLSFDKLEANFTTIKRIQETLKNVTRTIDSFSLVGKDVWKVDREVVWISREFREDMQWVMQDFITCLEDDFNMPEALVLLFSFQKYVNAWIADKKFSTEELESILDMYQQLDSVFWIINWDVIEAEDEEIPWEITDLLEKRNSAKDEKNFETADKLRDELLEKGFKIVDSREGSRVEKI